MSNKLINILEYSQKLNDFFISFGVDGEEHLNIISAYIAFCIHKDIVSVEQLDQMRVLISELIKYFEYIDKLPDET